jgi:hypothetical protein
MRGVLGESALKCVAGERTAGAGWEERLWVFAAALGEPGS